MRKPINYPMGSISSGTMRPEDLIPYFCYTLDQLARESGIVPAKRRKAHRELVREIESRIEANGQEIDPAVDDNDEDYFDSDQADYDLNESLFDALGEYAAPYFYFGSHPGDGADYGFWLSESWDEDFDGIKVDDLNDIPAKYRGEVAEINDHGNITLYVKTSRAMREIWSAQ